MREMLSFDKMVARDIISWNAMIVGYGNHGLRMEACTEAILQFHHTQASGIKPDDVTFIGLLSACSHSGLVIEGKHWFSAMSQEFNITPWMEHYICVVDLSPGLDFWMGHKSPYNNMELGKKYPRKFKRKDLQKIVFVLQGVEEKEKERILHYHCEKLAIAYAILSLSPGKSILVTKNLRVCGDYHAAIKLMITDLFTKREITARDVSWFHHFKDGICNCADFW
ncbi:hypothetical protein ACFX2J_039440 [Malus domestica]